MGADSEKAVSRLARGVENVDTQRHGAARVTPQWSTYSERGMKA